LRMYTGWKSGMKSARFPIMLEPQEYNTRFNFSIAPNELAEQRRPTHLLLSSSLRESHTFGLYADILHSRGACSVFLPFETRPEDETRLASLLSVFRRTAALETIMVSDPFKGRVQRYVDELTERASASQSVNLITKADGQQMVGDNLDGLAFKRGLTEIDRTALTGHAVFFFGCGGVSSAVAMALGPELRRVGLTDIDEERAHTLRRSFHAYHPNISVHVFPSTPSRDLREFQTLYNGTGLGKGAMEGRTPLFDDDLTQASFFIDAIYTPSVTRFLGQGIERRARAINGLSHMLASTTLHCGMITGQEISLEEVRNSYVRLFGSG
jgi:shikimate 5-dehydrogenase